MVEKYGVDYDRHTSIENQRKENESLPLFYAFYFIIMLKKNIWMEWLMMNSMT
jgi:hypothetical protein